MIDNKSEVSLGAYTPLMSLREYAAIQLKVPDSGIVWLDNMIKTSILDDFASKAMQGFCVNKNYQCRNDLVHDVYAIAKEMMKATGKL